MHFCTILHREAGFKLNEELLGNGNEIFENGMRLGITTGSCAAAASYAAAKALLGEKNEVLRVKTEVGITLEFEILNLNVNWFDQLIILIMRLMGYWSTLKIIKP